MRDRSSCEWRDDWDRPACGERSTRLVIYSGWAGRVVLGMCGPHAKRLDNAGHLYDNAGHLYDNAGHLYDFYNMG